MKQTLTVICGWPMSGKTTIARGLEAALGIHWLDADPIWVLHFGKPNPNPVTDEELKKDGMEVRRTYQLLIMSAGLTLEMGRSLIISAPFSRTVGWADLGNMLTAFPEVQLKAVWCHPKGDGSSEVAARLEARVFGENCWSSVNTEERYMKGKSRFEIPPVPHFELDTSPPNTPEESIQQAVDYVRS